MVVASGPTHGGRARTAGRARHLAWRAPTTWDGVVEELINADIFTEAFAAPVLDHKLARQMLAAAVRMEYQ